MQDVVEAPHVVGIAVRLPEPVLCRDAAGRDTTLEYSSYYAMVLLDAELRVLSEEAQAALSGLEVTPSAAIAMSLIT